MSRPSAEITSLPLQVKLLSDAQEERYGAAIGALKRSTLRRDRKSLDAALDLAMYHCEKARAFDWRERRIQKRRREVALSWEAANKAALKLAVHFEKLEGGVGEARLATALFKSGLKMRSEPKRPLQLAFAQFLRALARQARHQDHECRIGPLGIPWSRKLPGREVILTLILAYSFRLAANHDGRCEIKLPIHDVIKGGQSWNVAALFASAALGRDARDPKAANKFLSDHPGQLYYRGWS